MDRTRPEIKNLGVKHQYYNKVVKEATLNNYTDVNLENEDVNVLAQIEIASYKKNVEYILDVLKSDDLLYVSTAIKKCPWLFTNNSYSHIIDPDYLKIHLYPNMTSKGENKLHKHIRNNIKDEIRAEKFYHAEDTIDAALKWLPSCSIPFIESKVIKHCEKIKKTRLFKRLCERSIYILDLIDDNNLSKEKLEAVKFVQKKNISFFLKTIDRTPPYEKLKLNKKTTKLLMTNCPNRIIENFNKYCKRLDIPTFAKYLKPYDVKGFIYRQASLEITDQFHFILNFEEFQQLVQRIPEEERFNFVNKVFIEQVHKSADSLPESEMTEMTKLFIHYQYCPKYVWYKFAPFEIAFNEMRHCSSDEKYDFINFLIKYSCRNQSHFQSILEYYRDKHNNDSFDSKINFVDELLKETNFCFYDDKSWSILNDIFKTLNVYTESENESSKYIEIVIVYKLIKNEPIEEVLKEKFNFSNSLKKYSKKLKPDEQSRIFNFIFNSVFRKTINLNKVENEEQFDSLIKSLINVLEILKDWGKELVHYPFVLQQIKYLVRMKTEMSWDTDLSHLYNIKKSWKQLMFEESLILEPSEKVCINALKHDPGLLERYEDKVEYLLCNSKLSLKEFLKKVRIYFSKSIAKRFINRHLVRLDQPDDHNIVIRNLCTLMMQQEILKVIYNYVPKEAKINWDEEDGLTLSIRRYIAKNMHFIRPHPPPDVILAYAKGDYLKYAVPSILAIFYNLKPMLFQKHVPKLFTSPVSLQKLAIRLAITKLHYDDLVKEFYNVWTNTKNPSMRSIIFQLTFKLLCRQKDNNKIQKIWNLLKMFIDNLTFKEDKSIYTLMYKTEGIPHTIKANFIEKNHDFLDSYLKQADTNLDIFERHQMEERLILDSVDVMENMNENFMFMFLEKLIDLKFFCKSPHAKQPTHRYINPCNGFISVLSVFLLCAKDENKQESKYKSILLPILQRALGKLNDEYRWKENIKTLLDYLRINLDQYALKNKMVIPLKMFLDIHKELVKSLNINEYYFLITQWKLTVEFCRHLHRPTTNENNETGLMTFDTKHFGRKCIEILKEDVEKYFPRIYLIFHKVLYETLKDLCSEEDKIKIYIIMLSDKNFIPGYLTILKIASICNDNDGTWDEILQILKGHPSTEVNMNYNYYFNEYLDTICT